ncbi:hypothetical protein FM119_11865 [Mycetocola reblochoni REB411]|uniref:Uncharacterized protein n=1 Tax=Mycetocola reblochoni REB411 TaxID=1255698 RepID=A0A1R4K7U9_9MICO|nr:hypothetical protein FM119_11865 [Mycetocola reblochoni REB411]
MSAAPAADELTALESDVLGAVANADFSGVYDFDRGRVTEQVPQVDVAVIELDEQGRIRDRANVLVSRDYPDGVVAPIDDSLSSSSVRWQRWEQNRFDGSGVYGEGTDIIPGREDAPLRYMSTYPASLLKSMAAFGLVFLSDHGAIDLEADYTFDGVTKPIQQWTSEMIRMSNNTSSQAMIKMLHEVRYEGQTGIEFLNDELQRLGLTTLQLQGTSATTGGGWSNGGVSMTSFDTARLDLILDGGSGGVLWTTDAGVDVASDVLSEEGRDWLLDIWSGSAYHWMLDTGNFCGWTTPYTGESQYPAVGIPAVVPESSLKADGTSTIAWAGSPFASIDVRPCNETAEVTYYNKYGLTYNAGSDAGIVRSLEGKDFRHYIIAVTSNLGYRYGDEELAATGNACLSNESSFCYTDRFPVLAGTIDAAIAARGAAGPVETPEPTATPEPTVSPEPTPSATSVPTSTATPGSGGEGSGADPSEASGSDAASGSDGGQATGSEAGAADDGSLAATGSDAATALTVLALLALGGGALALTLTRRRRTAGE